MTTGNINVLDYLTDEQMQEIAANEFRRLCVETYRTDHERIFSNAAYKTVAKIVDETFDGKMHELAYALKIRQALFLNILAQTRCNTSNRGVSVIWSKRKQGWRWIGWRPFGKPIMFMRK